MTLDEFLQQPDTKPASEYIDGQVIQKPMPKTEHSILQTDLAAAIASVLRLGKKGRAMTELRCTFAGLSIVPDITVMPWADVPKNNDGKAVGDFLAAPPWAIEILSAGQSQTKVVRKIFHALGHGTQLGWLIDPLEDCVFTYTPDLKVMLHEALEQSLPVPEFARDFTLTLGELIAWLYE